LSRAAGPVTRTGAHAACDPVGDARWHWLTRAMLVLMVLLWPVLPLATPEASGLRLAGRMAERGFSPRDLLRPMATHSSAACGTARPDQPRPDGRLVAAYGLEEGSGSTAADASGRSHRATLVNATWTQGRFGKGLALNGTSGYLRIDAPSWPTRDYTYAAWVFPATVSGSRAVLDIQAPASGGVEVAIAPGGRIEVWSSGRLRLRTGIRLAAAAWTHVALTRAGALITAYVDGVAQRAGRDRRVFDFRRCPALIGVDADLGCTGRLNGFFSGVIDEVRIYDCALAAREIRSIMNAPIGPVAN
jgi:Concanavalin A-like lectin/glucanases superfamily